MWIRIDVKYKHQEWNKTCYITNKIIHVNFEHWVLEIGKKTKLFLIIFVNSFIST